VSTLALSSLLMAYQYKLAIAIAQNVRLLLGYTKSKVRVRYRQKYERHEQVRVLYKIQGIAQISENRCHDIIIMLYMIE
jgi:hypothetical protein